jgi:SAM-dependent methyltransferase
VGGALSRRDLEAAIEGWERRLRTWYTKDDDAILRDVNELDLGWGGVQRWASAAIPPIGSPHLDFACGYGTFLAQLGWRFPHARLVGLDIDFGGPHARIRELLKEAGVEASLVRGDARRMPFEDGIFPSVSCFLGLQDIEIGFGESGLRAAIAEATRVLRPGRALTLMDEFPLDRFEKLLEGLPLSIMLRAERSLDVRWTREVATRAIEVFADGWVVQTRTVDPEEQERTRADVRTKMTAEMERQLEATGHYVPFGPVRMVVARRIEDKT